ncbi:hypothetical protein VE03_08807 [Pseudogymnoascus sp. 23342-1-I1]|nr:hypothetical protein VE03_08807 [Pseudogymnoascus sp. 23342-1-I1]
MAEYSQKDNIPCPCGDEAHKDLEDWYEAYLKSSAEETVLFEDKFNKAAIEEKIQELSSLVPVSNGYCPSCQKLLDEWPDIINKVPERVPDDFEIPYQQPHFKNTLDLETGWWNECLLCTLFVQCSVDRGYSLQNWHRKENSLNCLGKSTQILVSVSSRTEGYYDLTLTWPGLDDYCWLPADPLYCIKNYDQSMLLAEVQRNKAYKSQNHSIWE